MYIDSVRELTRELESNENKLIMLLKTSNNIYSFKSKLEMEQEKEILCPIKEFLKDKDYKQYDVMGTKVNSICYIDNTMVEYESTRNLNELICQIQAGQVNKATIKSIENEKIKMIIFKKGKFIFVYRYNTSKLFNQPYRAIFKEDAAVVEKDGNSILVLSKMIPDIIIDIENEVLFMLNVKQSEFILEIDSLFTQSITNVHESLREFKLMKEDTIEMFINAASGNNTFMRKLHKIQSTESYKYLKTNIDKVPRVIARYGLSVEIDSTTKELVFNEDTEVSDILHLLADDYVQRYISEKDDIIDS